jgi:gamma-glutamylcyclotransferase (GGCT)/AIG2-like uncharacterized protein YtfP
LTPQSETDLLFVYGSLMRDQPAGSILYSCECLGPASIKGFALFDLGEYPAIYPAGNDSCVRGELFRMKDPASTLARLDEYEDVPALYVREPADVECAGDIFRAWAYILTDDPKGRFSMVPGGHWPSHRRVRST